MNGCEYLKCHYWNGQKCTDPVEWVNDNGPCCCRRDDARFNLPAPSSAQPDALREAVENMTEQIKGTDARDMNEASWGYEKGILLTANEAKIIKAALSAPAPSERQDANTKFLGSAITKE